MLKGEPVDENELNNQPPINKPDLLSEKQNIENENPELAQGINPYEGVDVQPVPTTNIINDIRYPGTSVLNPSNSIVPNNNSNNTNNINLSPNLSEFPPGLDPNPENNIPEDQKIPYIHGEKTIICWNCVSVLMVKDEWSVVRCTNCGKINRVPGTEDNLDGAIRLNDNMNHFDLYVPFVYAVITCPFCQAENKVRKDAEHIICFQCHNSYNVQHEPWENMVANKQLNNKEYPVVQQPTVVNTCDNKGNEETQRLLKKLIKVLKNQEKKPIPIMPMYDRYRPIRELVRDVDDIDDRRFNGVRKNNFFFDNDKLDKFGNGLLDKGISEISKKISNIDINVENRNNNNPLLGKNKDIEMESLKKKLYNEIRNDPKYQGYYGKRNSGINNNNKFNYSLRPFSFKNSDERKSMQYFSDKPKNDAVYKLMFKKNGELKKSYDINNNDINEDNLLIESKSKFDNKKEEKIGLNTSKLPIGKMLKTKEEVNDILKNLNIDFQI